MNRYNNYVNGVWASASKFEFIKLNPADEEEVGYFPQSNSNEVEEAVAAAKNAYPRWRATSRVKRAELFNNLAQLIDRNHDDLASAICIDTGKSFNEAEAEVTETLHMIQYTFGKGREPCGDVIASELADRDCVVIRKPKGIVAVIAPWNFPAAIPGSWTAAPALLEGNTVVIKPSEDAPYTAYKLADLYHKAGFPPGVINVIHGDGEVGDLLSRHQDINHICFTGSYAVSKLIRQACANSDSTTCSCETGSKSALIVLEDADIDLAVSAAVNSAFKLSGQRCVSAGRIIIQRSIFNDFVNSFIDETKKVVTKAPFEGFDVTSITMGPIINKSQMGKVMGFNELVRNDNEAKVIWDQDGIHGRMPRPGYFLRPFVYKTEWRDKPYLKKEVFGPHVALIPFDNIDDAIRIYNDTAYGLSVGVVTENFRAMRRLREELDYGMMYVNLGCIGAESHTNFQGVKCSGYGGGSAAGTFDNVVHKVTVSTNYGKLTFPQGLK